MSGATPQMGSQPPPSPLLTWTGAAALEPSSPPAPSAAGSPATACPPRARRPPAPAPALPAAPGSAAEPSALPRGALVGGGVPGSAQLTWSRNMREMISRTCRAHCCSDWALARNLSRSSIPLMCSAHSTRSCTLASPSTPWGGGVAEIWRGGQDVERQALRGSPRSPQPWYLLLRGVRGHVQHVAQQQQDPLDQQRVLLLPLLPLLRGRSREGSWSPPGTPPTPPCPGLTSCSTS